MKDIHNNNKKLIKEPVLLPSFIERRPILLLANSSHYLLHYRSLLLSKLKEENLYPIVMSPYDSYSSLISSLALFIPWRLSRSQSLNPFPLFISFVRLLFLIRALKPRLVHSHTLKPNLLSSIVTSIFGIYSYISFAGLGILSRQNKFKYFIFSLIIKSITYFSTHQRSSRWKWYKNKKRTTFIFQNPVDISTFKKIIGKSSEGLSIKLIPGSGVPKIYLNSNNSIYLTNDIKKTNKISIIFCARLLISKGIILFIELSDLFPDYDFHIYGLNDPASSESLTENQISEYIKSRPNIKLNGFKSNPLLLHLEEPSILVVPSIYGEGLPRAIPEAMSLGIPVIASTKACSGLFENDVLFKIDDHKIKSYSNAIKEIDSITERGEISDMLIRAKKYASDNFTEKQIVDQTIDLYMNKEDHNITPYIFKKDKNKLINNLPT